MWSVLGASGGGVSETAATRQIARLLPTRRLIGMSPETFHSEEIVRNSALDASVFTGHGNFASCCAVTVLPVEEKAPLPPRLCPDHDPDRRPVSNLSLRWTGGRCPAHGGEQTRKLQSAIRISCNSKNLPVCPRPKMGDHSVSADDGPRTA